VKRSSNTGPMSMVSVRLLWLRSFYIMLEFPVFRVDLLGLTFSSLFLVI
jgi:hypothetical protein